MKPTSNMFLVANRERAYFFRRQGRVGKLILSRALKFPEAQLKNQEITSDHPGRVFSSSPGHTTAYAPTTTPEEDLAITFARSLSEEIQHLDEQEPFDWLTLVAEPRMLGIIKGQLDRHCTKRISETVTKDFATLDEEEIRERLLDL